MFTAMKNDAGVQAAAGAIRLSAEAITRRHLAEQDAAFGL